jgi:hypothetical protein
MGGLKKAKSHENAWLCDQKQARTKRTFYRIPDPPRPSVNGADTPVCPSLPIAACTRAPLESSHTSVYRLLSANFPWSRDPLTNDESIRFGTATSAHASARTRENRQKLSAFTSKELLSSGACSPIPAAVPDAPTSSAVRLSSQTFNLLSLPCLCHASAMYTPQNVWDTYERDHSPSALLLGPLFDSKYSSIMCGPHC